MQVLNFSELDEYTSVAVAVSGGADSMALAHMLAQYAATRKKPLRIVAMTVDHGLRKGSKAEAAKVAKWLADWPNTTHVTLRWIGRKPKTAIMENARAARYALMEKTCKVRRIKILAVAHHADDQAETFFMRLVHGSGLDGLASMRKWTDTGDDTTLRVYRPLLAHSHEDLLAYCKKHKIGWIEDPSNHNSTFMRPRFRKFLASEGLDTKRLATTIERLGRAQEALSSRAQTVHKLAVIEGRQKATQKTVTLDWTKLRHEPFEILLRVVRQIIISIARSSHGPRLDRLETLLSEALQKQTGARFTIGGCIISLDTKAGQLKIAPEKPAQPT